MKKTKLKTYLNVFIKVILVFVITAIGFYIIICCSIAGSVNSISREAIGEYGLNRIDSLIAYVDSNEHSLRKRNSAVWALGQIGDKHAISILKKYYASGRCCHNTNLCQHELKKALDGCAGKFNATAWMRNINYFSNIK